MTTLGDDTPDLGIQDISRTLQYDTSGSTTTEQRITGDARRPLDYEAMNDLIKKDLADLRETQRREHAQMMVGLARCEELESLAREHARARERQFFTPTDNVLPDLSVVQIPILLNPHSLQASGPPSLPTQAIDTTYTLEQTTF